MTNCFSMSLRACTASLACACVGVALWGCAVRPPSEENWKKPSDLLTITVESRPTGAEVYGVSGDNLGSRIGTTPLTIRFYLGNYSTIWCDNCGDVDQVLDVAEHDPFLVGTERSYVGFKCAVIKEGFEPYVIRETVLDWSANTLDPFNNPDINKAFDGVRKHYTAILQSSAPPAAAQPIQPPQQQQQQQQQQQTVVLGGGYGSTPIGTINLTCNVPNAEVYVDGAFVGNAPATLKLQEGMHIIEARASGYVEYRKEVRVLGNSEISLRAELGR